MRAGKFAKLFAVAALIAVVAVRAASEEDEDEEEDDSIDESAVKALTTKTFEATVKNGTVLVEFYAPWCGHCKQLKPHYAKAALQLKKEEPSIVLAKVDADKYKSLGKKYGVTGFPTLKWFSDGKIWDYNGGRTEDMIVSWVKKRLGPATQALSTSGEHDTFTSSAGVVVVGYFEEPKEDNPDWQAFQDAARDIEGVPFAHAQKKPLHDHAGHKEGDIVLHKKHDGGSKVMFEGVRSTQALKDWVGIHQLAVVTDFSPDHSSKIFASPIKRQVLFFANKSADDYAAMRGHFTDAAKEYFGKVVAVAVSAEHKSVMDFFGVRPEHMPCIYAVRLADDSAGGGKTTRYRGPAGAELLSSDGVSAFIRDLLAGKVPPHKKSEPPPAEPEDEHGVTTLVGSSFEKIAMDPSKDVLVEFYAPWCGHCKQLAPIYNELGTELKNVSSMVIAKMDATSNDPPEGTDVQGFPTIKFYKAGGDGKNKTVMDFEGERTLDGFREFLEENAGIPYKTGDKSKKKKKKNDTKSEL